MALAVQLLSISNDRLLLDEAALATALLAEHYKDKPVVVLAAIGGGGAALMTSLVHKIETSSLGGAPMTSVCFPLRGSGSAGMLMWPHLLPVRLPSGQAAGALLLYAWGALDSCSEGGSAVLSLAALLSSVLVVGVSESGGGDLQQLEMLTPLATAAATVDQCSPLQEVMFLVHDWRGAKPAGHQKNFEPLEDWAQASAARHQALVSMCAVSDWFKRVSLFLVPPTDVAATGLAVSTSPLHQSHLATSQLNPTGLLASSLSAKTFNSDPLLAYDLLQHFTRLVGAIPTLSVSPPDAGSMIHTLVELSQQQALRRAEQVYIARLTTGCDPAQLDNFRAGHQRAAHEARMALMATAKMTYLDSEACDGDDALSARCEHIYGRHLELLEKKASKLRNAAKLHNEELQDRCTNNYKSSIEKEMKEVPLMPMASFISLHEQLQQKTLAMFDTGKDAFGGVENQERQQLYEQVQLMFRRYLDELTALQEQAKDDENNIDNVVRKAVLHYVDIMKVVPPHERRAIHGTVQEGSLALCESSKLLILSISKSNALSKVRAKTDAELNKITTQAQAPAAVAYPYSSYSSYSSVQHGYAQQPADGSHLNATNRHSSDARYSAPYVRPNKKSNWFGF